MEQPSMTEEETSTRAGRPTALLAAPPRVINVGLARFAEDIAAQGAGVVHVRWAPPAGGDQRLAELLSRLGR
jgi:FdrA protein